MGSMFTNRVLKFFVLAGVIAIGLVIFLRYYIDNLERPENIVVEQTFLTAEILEVHPVQHRISRFDDKSAYTNYIVTVELPDGKQARLFSLYSPVPEAGMKMPLVKTLYYDGSKSLTVDVSKWQLSQQFPVK